MQQKNLSTLIALAGAVFTAIALLSFLGVLDVVYQHIRHVADLEVKASHF